MMWTTQPRSECGALAAIRTGPKPTVLFIHGVGLRAEAWAAQLAALSGKAECVAVDLPGHGNSPLPERAQTISDYSEAVASCLDRPMTLVGHSMGALIALDLALRNPDRVRGVVALNTIFQRTPQAAAAVQARASALDGVSPVDPETTLQRWFGDAASPERTACEAWLRSVHPKAYKLAYTVFANADGPNPDDLAQLPRPAVFATGAEEPNSTPDMSAALARIAPQGQAKVIAGAAHMMPMTHVGAVNDILLRHLGEGL